MHRTALNGMILLLCLFGMGVPLQAADALAPLKFNEVREVAPGVFFRYASISATDTTVPFGGSNNIWIVFKNYVVVIDANFPKEAGDVIEAIKKTTDKPIRYVLDTHQHGDHAYGNAVFAQAGASIISQANCARWLREKGAQEFAAAGRGPTGRKDVAASTLKVPELVFEDKLVLDDGTQRVECLFLGHAHTPGDAFAYLPKHKILCTGDACVNGAFNFMGHSDSASWIRALERAQQLEVKLVLPGHGPIAGQDVLEKQKRYFVELRQQVERGIEADKTAEDINAGLEMPWYREWTGVRPSGDNVKYVYAELTGQVAPWDLAEDFGIYEGSSPTQATLGWTKPRRIVVPNLMPARLAELKRVAPEVEFIPARDAEEAAKVVEDADAVVGFCTPDLIKAGKNLRWIHANIAGVDKLLAPEVITSKVVLTNTQRVHGPNVAEQAFALLLALTRNLRPVESAEGGRSPSVPLRRELHGKTMLVIGLGGVGTAISKRAQAFGMRVIAVDPKEMERPAFVFSLHKPDKLLELLPKADVVVLACPLTAQTRGLMGEAQFRAMKKSAYFINIARGAIVQTPALVAALEKKQVAGAGMDVTDPEPLPASHALWRMPNVVISPHVGGQSPDARERQWRLLRENLRRFASGEPLLCVVDKQKGY
jgi:phosphoglycerate dehydrogenase-like enzyme/glyoxylase-like metal-dependent hydrolase (beta-lactamase superfamily II)